MDIATAKPTAQQRQRVPHHLIDILDPAEECTVSLFQSAALQSMATIEDEGHVPLLVGGTGLYHRAVIDQLEIPGQFPEVRRALEERCVDDLPGLYGELAAKDPLAASRIDASNGRRVVRALEVLEGSGRPFSSFGPGLQHYDESLVHQIGLRRDRAVVDAGIEDRVVSWLDEGLLVEATELRARPNGMSRTAAQAIGYREMFEHLDGTLSLDEAVAETIRRTRNLARRQRAWFERDPRVTWFDEWDSASAGIMRALEHASVSRVVDAVGD
jgi:tRNA dimethylallyltransferase